MNIELIGRIRPALGSEKNTLVVDGAKVAVKSEGPFLNFSTLHQSNVKNADIFRRSFYDLLDSFMKGYNVCVLLLGESGSGRTYTMSGEGVTSLGFAPMIFEHLFVELTKGRYKGAEANRKQHDFHVTMQLTEIYNELIKDLLSPQTEGGSYRELSNEAIHGTYVKGATKISLRDSTDAGVQYRQGMARRTGTGRDVGSASQHAAILLFIDLVKYVGEEAGPNRSRFSIIKVPGLERLEGSYNDLLYQEEPILNKALVDLTSVVNSVPSIKFPESYHMQNKSKFVQLLEDVIGGNYMTKALLCLNPDTHPDTMSAILKFCNKLTHVRNFPIVNDWCAQGLITKFRARIIDLLSQGYVNSVALDSNEQKKPMDLETNLMFYKEENERLKRNTEDMRSKMENMAHSKSDLSKHYLTTEEDKLRISQSLVEMQLENIRIKQEAEEIEFKLKQRVDELEGKESKLQQEIKKMTKASRHAEDLRNESDQNRKDLADEYTNLMANRLTLMKELEKERKRNEEMSLALLNMAQKQPSRGGLTSDQETEVRKAQEVLRQNEAAKQKAKEIEASQVDRVQVENLLLYERKKYEKEISKLEMDHRETEAKLQQRLESLQRQIEESKLVARDRQRRLAELNSSLIMTRADKEQLESQSNRLQHKVKSLGEDYRYKLLKYVEDVSTYVDKPPSDTTTTHMKDYVQTMIKDLTKSHKDREEQLAEVAQQHRNRQQTLQHQYEQLLVQYRNLRQQCEESGIQTIDLGPDESELNLPESVINSANMKEIIRLKSEVNKLRQLELNWKLKNVKGGEGGKFSVDGRGSVDDMRKQLREFTANTQKELEMERARLLSDNASLKEQLISSQEYIREHLRRYKDEIIKLRKQLGYDVNGPLVGLDVSYRRSRRK